MKVKVKVILFVCTKSDVDVSRVCVRDTESPGKDLMKQLRLKNDTLVGITGYILILNVAVVCGIELSSTFSFYDI